MAGHILSRAKTWNFHNHNPHSQWLSPFTMHEPNVISTQHGAGIAQQFIPCPLGRHQKKQHNQQPARIPNLGSQSAYIWSIVRGVTIFRTLGQLHGHEKQNRKLKVLAQPACFHDVIGTKHSQLCYLWRHANPSLDYSDTWVSRKLFVWFEWPRSNQNSASRSDFLGYCVYIQA